MKVEITEVITTEAGRMTVRLSIAEAKALKAQLDELFGTMPKLSIEPTSQINVWKDRIVSRPSPLSIDPCDGKDHISICSSETQKEVQNG